MADNESDTTTVWKSASATKSHRVRGEHTWIIEDYEKLVGTEKSANVISSDKFSVWRDTGTANGREKITFQLQVFPNSFKDDEGTTHIGTYLKMIPEGPNQARQEHFLTKRYLTTKRP